MPSRSLYAIAVTGRPCSRPEWYKRKLLDAMPAAVNNSPQIGSVTAMQPYGDRTVKVPTCLASRGRHVEIWGRYVLML